MGQNSSLSPDVQKIDGWEYEQKGCLGVGIKPITTNKIHFVRDKVQTRYPVSFSTGNLENCGQLWLVKEALPESYRQATRDGNIIQKVKV